MRRWWYLIASVAAIGGLIGLYLLVSFLVGLTLDDADKWTSVVGGLTAVTVPLATLVAWLLRKAVDTRSSREKGDPSWEAIREPYLRGLQQRFQHLDLEVLTPLSEQDDHPPLRLAEVFVGQQVKGDPPTLELPRELLLRVMEGELAEVQELPPTVDRATLAGFRQAYEQRPSQPVLEVIGRGEARLVLLGDPGAGKSTLGKYLAYTLAGDATGPLSPLDGWLPVLIQLREYASLVAADPHVNLLDFIDRRRAEGLGLPKDTLETFLRRDGRAAIFFDGLDEVFDPKLRDLVTRHIAGFAQSFPRTRIVVTSRIVGYHGAVLKSAGFVNYKLQDLDNERIKEFVRRWYRLTCQADSAEATRLAQRLLAAIGASKSIRELAGNPMLLTILAIIGRRRMLPRDRVRVFEHAVSVLVEHWDPSKFLEQNQPDSTLPYLDVDDKMELLRLIARRMQDSPSGLSGNFITAQELTGEFTEFLRERDRQHVSLDTAKKAATAMLAQFRERNFILSRFGGGLYGFVHRSFLEYLAAADIADRFNRTRELTEEHLIDVFRVRWADTAWHEVLLLLTGMLGEATADKAIAQLVKSDPHWAADLSTEAQHIVLALGCAAEVRKVGRLTTSGPMIVEELIRTVETINLYKRNDLTGLVLSSTIDRNVIPLLDGMVAQLQGVDNYLGWFRRRSGVLTELAAASATRIAIALEPLPQDFGLLKKRVENSQDRVVRQAAVKAIAGGWPNDPATLPLLHQIAGHDTDEDVRQTAIEAITTGWHDHLTTLPLLHNIAAQDGSQSVARRAAMRGIITGWPNDPATLPLLHKIAEHDTHELAQQTAIEAVTTGWHDHPTTLPLLHKIAKRDQSQSVRQAAVRAITNGWPNDPTTRLWLHNIAEDDHNQPIRIAAVQAIANTRSDDTTTLAWLRNLAEHDQNRFVRQAAVLAVANGWPDEPTTLPWLRNLAEHDRNQPVRMAAVQAIANGWHDHPTTLPLLHNIAENDRSHSVRQTAVQVIATGWHDHPTTLPLLHNIAENDRTLFVRQAAIQALLAARRDDPTTLPLFHHIADGGVDKRIRLAAIEAVAAGWRDHPETLPWLRDRARNDRSEEVRRTALRIAGVGWHNDPQNLLWLNERADHDKEESVRAMASRVMEAILHIQRRERSG